MVKVYAGMILHYGKDYVTYAIRSVYWHVDKIVVFYTDRPSHGTASGLQRPETEQEIMDAVHRYDPEHKVIVIKGEWSNESEHRIAMEQFCWSSLADEILVLDADEVWPAKYLEYCLKYAREKNCERLAVHMNHFYRSFDWACTEPSMPQRIIRLGGKGVVYAERHDPSVLHFGYCIPEALMKYKISVHGHYNEFRPGWFENIFCKWPDVREEIHPTCVGAKPGETWWTAKPFDRIKIPEFMCSHPFWNLEVVR